jgi:hypothetical protein
MSDRENPYMKDRVLTTSRWNRATDEWEYTEAVDLVKVLAYDPAAALAAVRAAVEDGTIEGHIEKIRSHFTHDGEWDWECVPVVGCPSDSEFIVIHVPVSDGGSET